MRLGYISNTTQNIIIIKPLHLFSDFSDSSESNIPRVDKLPGTIERRSNSERKRNVKIASFKSLIESKIFSKSEKELEKIGLVKSPEKVEKEKEKEEEEEEPIIENTLEQETKQLSRSASIISTKSVTNLVKGKSMPSLR